VQAHPQGGWDFVAYPHLAIPFGIGLFLVWLAIVVPVRNRARRLGLVAATAAGAAIWYPLVRGALLILFSMMFMLGDSVTLRLRHNLIYVLIPLTPVLFAGLLWCFGVRPKALRLAFSVLVYVEALPISVVLLSFFPSSEEGWIDAVKTGLIIPFLIVGLGILAFPSEAEVKAGSAMDDVDSAQPAHAAE